MNRLLLLAALAVAASHGRPSIAQSLWQVRHPDFYSLTSDTQARDIGDTLLIRIAEVTDMENRDEREVFREDKGGDVFDFTGSTGGQLGSLDGQAGLDSQIGTSSRLTGDSEHRIERDFSDSISVLVVDKLPNGNLIVNGVRHRIISGERRTLRISGIVRPIDISPDNSISSRLVANFTMCYAGEGHETQYTAPGWLRRTLNAIRLHEHF